VKVPPPVRRAATGGPAIAVPFGPVTRIDKKVGLYG
jgi:hypothetical protein